MSSSRLAIEASTVGVITGVIGFVVLFVAYKLVGDSNLFGKNRRELYIIVGSLVVTGMLIHLLCEYTGINKWYCTNGNACL